MYLRRLLFSKLGQIYRDRKVVLNGMPTEEEDGICCSSDKLGDMTDSAEELRNSGAEELITYMQFSSAFYRGVGHLGFERLLPIVCLLVPAMATKCCFHTYCSTPWGGRIGPSAVLGSHAQHAHTYHACVQQLVMGEQKQTVCKSTYLTDWKGCCSADPDV